MQPKTAIEAFLFLSRHCEAMKCHHEHAVQTYGRDHCDGPEFVIYAPEPTP